MLYAVNYLCLGFGDQEINWKFQFQDVLMEDAGTGIRNLVEKFEIDLY